MAKEIKEGSKVKYLGINGKCHAGKGWIGSYYPPIGTIGTILDINRSYGKPIILIQWPEGTTMGDGKWYCDEDFLEVVDE